MKQRNSFSSKLGFILAASGSAVGLGNLWRFPYLAAKYGGGSFLIVYLILAVTFGFTLATTEIAIGRKTGKSALYAFESLSKKYKFIGVLASVVPIIIMPYYCVIGGWVIKFAWLYLTGNGAQAVQDNYFAGFTSQTAAPIFWLVLFVIATTIVILLGVNKGIENFSRVLMPLLVVLSILISVFVMTRPGSGAGLKYYFIPDFSRFSVNGFLAALGQLFYSMSLAMGIMITFGSYLPKDADIESSVRQIEIFDSAIAILAGLMIVPSVFVFSGGSQESLSAGPTLMFITIPKVFNSMVGGNVLGAAFFVLVLFAALTSAISLMETVVSIFVEKYHKERKIVTLCVMVYTILMALPSSLGFGLLSKIKLNGMSILDMFDFVSNSILMPIVALLTCLFVGFIIKPKTIIDEIKTSTDHFKNEKFYTVLVKYISPILLVLILISSILNSLNIIHL